jgi:ATPase subunit of ABC transporter with duplicated ATPase domains
MSSIRLSNVFKSYDAHPVLREVYFRVSPGDRVGLIGRNGAGKTTTLRLILGHEDPDEGTVEVDADLKIGYFSQFSELQGEKSVVQVLDDLFEDIHTLEYALLEVETALEGSPPADELNRLLLRQANLLEEMQKKDGWNYANMIDTVLTRLGFSDVHRRLPIDRLSGGWSNRAALARILLQEPDILLMDEPTNYLDLEGLEFLEDWFTRFRGGLVVISHDRHFLDRVVNRLVEIENYHMQEYSGSFTQYVREKPLRMKTLERQFEHEEELLALESEAISDRQDSLRNPTQALKRKLANIKKELKPRLLDKIITDIYLGLYVPSDLCLVEGLTKSYDGRVLIANLSFDLHKGDRIVVVGPNGCGKTTLLKILLEDEEASAGHAAWAKGGSYVSFNQVFTELDLNDSVSHAVNVIGLAYSQPRKVVNRFLGLMQFSEMDLTARIGTLSGGQRARVALAKALLSGASTILLDEPTNHLDLLSTQVMERALQHFPGAVIAASHDRFFIDKVANRLLVFEAGGKVKSVWGNWSTWQGSSN